MHKVLSTSAFLLATAIATPAFAQDAPPRDEFSGVYIGGSVGATFNSSNDSETILFDRNLDGTFGDTVTTSAGANAFAPSATVAGAGFCSGEAGRSPISSTRPAGGCESENRAVEYSFRAGFDSQMDNFVIGAIGEIGRTEYNSSVTAFSTTPASYTFTREIDSLINLRLRAGVTVTPTTLLYATGGVGYVSFDNSFRTTNTANSFTQDLDDDSFGFVAGAGLEQKLGRNFSIGVEYLYQQYKDDSNVRVGNNGTTPATNPFLLGNTAGTDFIRSEDKFNLHSVRAVVNFRF